MSEGFGRAPALADTSAWSRANAPPVRVAGPRRWDGANCLPCLRSCSSSSTRPLPARSCTAARTRLGAAERSAHADRRPHGRSERCGSWRTYGGTPPPAGHGLGRRRGAGGGRRRAPLRPPLQPPGRGARLPSVCDLHPVTGPYSEADLRRYLLDTAPRSAAARDQAGISNLTEIDRGRPRDLARRGRVGACRGYGQLNHAVVEGVRDDLGPVRERGPEPAGASIPLAPPSTRAPNSPCSGRRSTPPRVRKRR